MTTRAGSVALTALGLQVTVAAGLFDLDGGLTCTAGTQAAAWAVTLDEVLRRRAVRDGRQFVPFDSVADYRTFVDGLPRDDGTRTFLASRGVVVSGCRPASCKGQDWAVPHRGRSRHDDPPPQGADVLDRGWVASGVGVPQRRGPCGGHGVRGGLLR